MDAAADVADENDPGDDASTGDSGTWGDGGHATWNGCGPADFVNRTAPTASRTITFGGTTGSVYSPRCLWVADGQTVTFNGDLTMDPLVPGTAPGLTATDPPGATPSPIMTTSTGVGVMVTFPMGVEGIYPFYSQTHGATGMYGAILVF